MTTTTQIAGVAAALAVVASTAVVLGAKKLGVFKKVVWAEGPMDALEFVYVEHKGPYKNIGAAFKRLEKELKEKGVAVADKTHTFVGAMASSFRDIKLFAARCSSHNSTPIDLNYVLSCLIDV